MLHDHEAAIEQVRRIAASLSTTERLALIRAIASLEPSQRGTVAGTGQSALDAEQLAWYARPLVDRQRYGNRYVAVQGGQVIDDDPDQRTLYVRVRERFGRQPVLIVKADWNSPPEFVIHSPRIEH